jgi:2-C-methyl-D-erythritol 4-phosphate cytidylyltransferase
MNIAIIVAAGSGSRFAGHQPKQFVDLAGRPLLIHTLEKFSTCTAIDEIVLVLSDEGTRKFDDLRSQFQLSKLTSVVIGGRNRAESVRNGLGAVSGSDEDIIAVHDGARPLVSHEEIAATFSAARKTGAACLVAEITDTIKEISGDFICNTVDRSQLRRALTPQAFRADILREAFDALDLTDAITDECYLVEKLGVKIALVEGSARNIKITRPEDLILAEALLKQ